MATTVLCCGFECGTVGTGTHVGSIGASVAFVTSGQRSGARALRINPSAASTGSATATGINSSNLWVDRFYIWFNALPDVDFRIFSHVGNDGVIFKAGDSKIYAGDGAGTGASGVSVTTGQWYRVDVKTNVSANPHLTDVQVNGVACGQYSRTATATSYTNFALGSTETATADFLLDDLVISHTAADYPIGPGKVEHSVPTADGTHNVASTNDFERSDTGIDIDNTTTDAYLLVDDIPLMTGTPTEFIKLILPPNATDYVEVIYGPAPGISTPTVAPRAVEVITVSAAAATQANNLRLALNDNGTLDDVRNATIGSTTCIYDRKHYALAPTGGAWTISAGNGNFNDLRMRCFSSDANPDPFFVGTMIEAEFEEVIAAFLPRQPYQLNQAVKRSNYW